MALSHSARLDRIPAYPTAAGYELPEDVAMLASNESHDPPIPEVVAAVEKVMRGLNRYPDPSGTKLREALSARYGVPAAQIALGNGSCDILLALGDALLDPGSELVFAWPSFSVYEHLEGASGAHTTRVPLDSEDRHDTAAMLEAIGPQTRMAILCNPNNPTGTALGFDEVREFVEAVPPEVCLVIDEAYCEYCTLDDPDLTIGLLEGRENLLLLRTFSKVYGLAGLRVGFALCGSEEIPAAVNRVRQPFFCSAAAQAAGVEALRHPEALVERVSRNMDGRAQVMAGLEQLGLSPASSEANFCWVGLPVPAGQEPAQVEERVLAQLASRGVLVRGGTGLGRAGWLRITFGSHDENARALEALAAAIA